MINNEGSVKTNFIKVISEAGNAWRIFANAGEIAADAITVNRDIERILIFTRRLFINFLPLSHDQGFAGFFIVRTGLKG
jgi:hypothetical protein